GRMSVHPVLGPINGTLIGRAGEILVEKEGPQTAGGTGGVHLVEDLLGGRHPSHLLGGGERGQDQDRQNHDAHQCLHSRGRVLSPSRYYPTHRRATLGRRNPVTTVVAATVQAESGTATDPARG